MSQQEKAKLFSDLHIPGTPVILYNIWDAGSAQAVASVDAKAIASGSHGVANAFGFEDGENIPLEIALENTKRIVTASGEIPVTMDIETGYGNSPDEVYETTQKVIATGAIGVNLEDQILGSSELRDLDEQAERIAAIRRAANDSGVALFINARTDLFKNADPTTHNSAMVDRAIVKAKAFVEAGANGLFVPGLRDIELIAELCQKSPLPVNIIVLPGMVSNSKLAAAGVARISYGPGPYLQMIEWLKEQAKSALTLS